MDGCFNVETKEQIIFCLADKALRRSEARQEPFGNPALLRPFRGLPPSHCRLCRPVPFQDTLSKGHPHVGVLHRALCHCHHRSAH